MNTRLVLLSPSSEQPSFFLIVGEAGTIVGRGTLAAYAAFKGRTILIVPGTDVVTRWLELEDGPQARAAAAAAVLLKDQISAPRDDVHVAVGKPEDGGKRPVSVVDPALMQEFLDRAAELGISPDVVIPDHLLLLPPDDGVLAVTLGSLVAVRGEQLAFSAEGELASMLIGSRCCRSMERIPEIEQLLAAGSAQLAINLLQQDFAAGGRGGAKWNGYRRVAALLAVAALSPLAIWTAEISRNEASARGLESRAEASARTIIGDAGSADPISELRGRLAGLRANDGFMQTTASLFEAISHAQGVELESLSYLQDGVIRATLIHPATSDLAALRGALKQSGIALGEDAAQERDGRMVTTITLERRS
jgi:general secretion pathway protein L